MKLNRNSALAITGVLTMATTTIAGGESSAKPADTGDKTTQQEAKSRSIAAENLLRKFAGEWEGRLEMRNEERASISIVSISSRFEADSNRFEWVGQGFAFGQPFDAAAMFALDDKGQPAKYWWTPNFEEKGSAWTWEIGEKGRSVIGKGREHQGSLATRYEHVMTYVDDDHFEVEWFNIDPDGERQRVAKMTMSRMNRGERADASERFEDGSFQAWSGMINGARAQVQDND